MRSMLPALLRAVVNQNIGIRLSNAEKGAESNQRV